MFDNAIHLHSSHLKVNAAASGFGSGGSFSASSSYKKAVKEVTKADTTTSEIVGRANVYKARLSSTGTISKVKIFKVNRH